MSHIKMNSFRSFLYSFSYILLIVFIFLITLSYHPVIVEISRSSGYESGTILSRYFAVPFIALFAMNISLIPFRCRFIKFYFGTLLLVIVVGIFIQAFYDNAVMISSIRDMAMCFLAILIGWRVLEEVKKLERVLLFFSIMTSFCGFMQIMTNIGGFVIANQYLVDAKNSLGVMLATSVISMLFVNRTSGHSTTRILALVFIFIGVIEILTIRARASLLAVVLVGLVVLLKSFGKNRIVPVVLLFTFLLCLSLLYLPDVIYDYVHDSIFSGTQSEDISSGRFLGYKYAIEFLLEGDHLLLGDINQMHESRLWIHNYVLLQVYRFGLVYSFPILLLYFYLAFYSIKHSFRELLSVKDCGYALVLLLFIISLLEPTFPYSPGSATLFNFMVLGSTLHYSYSSREVYVH